MRDSGNAKGAAVWEASMPSYYVRARPDDSTPFKEQFIRSKYERKEFIDASLKPALENVRILHKEGFLTKQGAVVKNWKRRWFVLRGSVLAYYKKPTDDEPAGEIVLSAETHCDSPNDLSIVGQHHFCFDLRTPGRTFLISADSVRVMYEWIQAIRQVKLRLYTLAAAGASVSPSYRGDPARYPELVAALRTASSGNDQVPAFQLRKHQGRDKKVYKECFLGVELIDWMLMQRWAASRAEAVGVAKGLIEKTFLSPASQVTDFVDGRECYVLKKD